MELKRDTLLQGGRYRIVDSIGRGGFGMTYLAEQVMAKRKVCIKEFFPKGYYKRESDTGSLTLSSEGFGEAMNKFKAKFIKEAQTIAALDHPNIIHIHDVFEENGTAYYVMDYIEGESLSDIVKRGGAMSERDAVAYIKQVAAALEHIHEQQIMHLDVKPGNIMVRTKDSHSILIDFGLSKHYDAKSGDATSTTPVGVSHGFAPMEQYKQGGVSKFSPETDIYSLGATLYYLVTGNVPPSATDIGEDGLPALPTHLSSSLCKTIEKSMSYRRKDRPQNIATFVALLDGCCASAPADESTKMTAAVDDEKTKIVAPQLKPQPKVEQPKVHIDREPKPKKSDWWVWTLLLLFIVVLLMSIKDLFSNGDNSKEVAKEEKRVEIPTEEVVTTPIESEQFVLNVTAEVESETPAAEATETSAPYKIGGYYNVNGKEGVVFEVSDGGHHGKIVSLDEAKKQWCTDEQHKEEIKLGLTNEKNGKVNTDEVMKRHDSNQYPAFVWCRNKGDHWYLPAKDELKAISNNISTINSTLVKYSGTKLAKSGWYWASTEHSKFSARLVLMDGGHADIFNKNFRGGSVRAVSAF